MEDVGDIHVLKAVQKFTVEWAREDADVSNKGEKREWRQQHEMHLARLLLVFFSAY